VTRFPGNEVSETGRDVAGDNVAEPATVDGVEGIAAALGDPAAVRAELPGVVEDDLAQLGAMFGGDVDSVDGLDLDESGVDEDHEGVAGSSPITRGIASGVGGPGVGMDEERLADLVARVNAEVRRLSPQESSPEPVSAQDVLEKLWDLAGRQVPLPADVVGLANSVAQVVLTGDVVRLKGAGSGEVAGADRDVADDDGAGPSTLAGVSAVLGDRRRC
jgi:hypothetical protein